MKIPGLDLDGLFDDLAERGDKMQDSLDQIVELLTELNLWHRNEAAHRASLKIPGVITLDSNGLATLDSDETTRGA